MKKILLLVGLVASTMLSAADIIILKNSTKIDAKILEVSSSEIKYKKINNLDGPMFVVNTNEINSIVFENGDVQTYSTVSQPSQSRNNTIAQNETIEGSTETIMSNGMYSSGKKAHFQFIHSIGVNFIEGMAGPSMHFGFGSRVRDYLYIGGGLGCENLLKASYVESYNVALPFYAQVRGYVPVKKKFMPFVEFSIGGTLDFIQAYYVSPRGEIYDDGMRLGGHFYTEVGAGFYANKFNFSVGYSRLMGANTGYVKIGYELPAL
ncbi:MAG: hypothetical protein MJZ75_00700 [Paludibacteraceae bacterium]|nr:hypothetical protein [Paludibacteraceae bacterium]